MMRKNTVMAALEHVGSEIQAARDVGTRQKDKARKVAVLSLVARAQALLDNASASCPNEVVDALKSATALQEHLTKLDDTSRRLRASPPGSAEASEAQVLVESIRKALDLTLPALKAALQTFEPLFSEMVALEREESSLEERIKDIQARLGRDRDRLKNAAMLLRGASSLY